MLTSLVFANCSILSPVFLIMATISGAFLARILDPSSLRVTSRIQWRLFSIAQCDLTDRAISWALAGRLEIKYLYSVVVFEFTILVDSIRVIDLRPCQLCLFSIHPISSVVQQRRISIRPWPFFAINSRILYL